MRAHPGDPLTSLLAAPIRLDTLWDATGLAAHLVLLVVILGGPVLLGWLLVTHVRHQRRLPTADDWRVPYEHARFPDVLAARVRTSHAPVPAHFSPSIHLTGHPAAAADAPPAALPPLTADEALNHDGLVYGRRLDSGELLVDRGVRSLAIGGRPGSGKTSTACLLAAQYVRMGAQLHVADPHAGHKESLVTRLEPWLGRLPAAETPREALQALEEVHRQLEQRKAGWRRSGGATRPVVLFIDEFPEVVRLLPPGDRARLLDLAAGIGYAGRKYGVATVLLAQSWLVAAVGSSQVRNPVPASIVHAMRADEARGLTGIPAGGWPQDPSALQVGEAFVVGVGSGPVLVRIPELGSPTRAPARGEYESEFASNPLPTLSVLTAEGGGESAQRVGGDFPESGGEGRPEGSREAEILRRFRHGEGYPEIIAAVYGKVAGERFKAARREVEATIRRAVSDGAGQLQRR